MSFHIEFSNTRVGPTLFATLTFPEREHIMKLPDIGLTTLEPLTEAAIAIAQNESGRAKVTWYEPAPAVTVMKLSWEEDQPVRIATLHMSQGVGTRLNWKEVSHIEPDELLTQFVTCLGDLQRWNLEQIPLMITASSFPADQYQELLTHLDV